MTPCTIAVLAATLTRFLDPYTMIVQCDEGVPQTNVAAVAQGEWSMPNGLQDPLAKRLRPRILYTKYFLFDTPQPGSDENVPSLLFKINQVGYLPAAPKFAYMGAWLGPELGAWKPHAQLTGWQLVDAKTGETVLDSPSPPVVRIKDSCTKTGILFTGEDTYEMDFSSVTAEGEYFVRVPGVGRSASFRIAASAAEEAFRVHMLGLYQKRCGIAKEEPWTHWTAGECHRDVVRGTFASEEGKLEPKVRWFDIIRWNTSWEDAEHIDAPGGWHDAADYDRRPYHLSIVNNLCAVYLMKKENFRDGQLSIPESANGIPDILDEADWGLRHLLAAQEENGGVGTWIETTAHPGPGSVAERDPMKYAVARPTRRSSMAYAAHAALLARCLPVFRDRYLESAKRAWHFAVSTKPREDIFEVKRKKMKIFSESEVVYWSEDDSFSADTYVKAAANLYALTGDNEYLTRVQTDMKRLLEDMNKRAWSWSPLLYAGERALGFPEELKTYFNSWDRKVLNSANDILAQIETGYAHRAPWYGPRHGYVHTMAWGNGHPLRRAMYLIAAHAMTGETKYLQGASLALDFHNGCNPFGMTMTSGLGTIYPVSFLDLPSYVDGIAEYVPGITPYRLTFHLPEKAIELVWGGNRVYANKWPIWRRWPNLENQTVKASEYTVWETIAPAASVTGYLITPGDSRPAPMKKPAERLSDLPGYWALP